MEKTVNQLVAEIKAKGEDFEWYPTTDSMIQNVVDFCRKAEGSRYSRGIKSVLDIGCGNGSFLARFKEKYLEGTQERLALYGMEKSPTLIENIPDNVVVIGTDLFQQSLLDKVMDLIFCNPPYSRYEEFMCKILNEAEADRIIFVVPERWKENKEIKKIIDYREFEYEVISSDDFLNAERKARAKVDIVCFTYKKWKANNAFSKWFDTQFKIKADMSVDYAMETEKKIEKDLVQTSNVAEQLVQFYQDDMGKLYEHYKALEMLDPELFKELGIEIDKIKSGLKNKIKGLKNIYWGKLFQRYDKITKQLCNFTRSKILSKFNNNNNIDFTIDNIFMVTMWVIRHANTTYDEQLTEFFMKLCNPDSIKQYKSNQRFNTDKWRYIKNCNEYSWRDFVNKEGISKVMLDYRIIYSGCGCWWRSNYSYGDRGDTSIIGFLQDCVIIAENLGFDIEKPEVLTVAPYEREDIGFNLSKFEIKYKNGDVFLSGRAYQNCNVHCKFDERFMQKLNIEVSRLNGWVQDKKEASEAFGVEEEEVNNCWGINKQFVITNPASLLEAL